MGDENNSNDTLFINRKGGPITFGSIDRTQARHSLIFAPTGAGMSAAINYKLLQDMAMLKPRVFIIDKGGSFNLLAKYFKENNNE